jgi:hypothetical protein
MYSNWVILPGHVCDGLQHGLLPCSMQYGAVRCSMTQWAAVWLSSLQYAAWRSSLQYSVWRSSVQYDSAGCSMHYGAVRFLIVIRCRILEGTSQFWISRKYGRCRTRLFIVLVKLFVMLLNFSKAGTAIALGAGQLWNLYSIPDMCTKPFPSL